MSSEEDRPVGVRYRVPREVRVGVYANTARFSFTPFEFTLDWAVLDPETSELDDTARAAIVCSRVHIPVSLVYDVLHQGINRVMTFYESAYGEIRRPGQ